MPNFWGCRCCGPSGGICTHRVFSSDGVLLWSGLDPSVSTAGTILAVDIDSGDRTTSIGSGYTGPPSKFFSLTQWKTSDASRVQSGLDLITTDNFVSSSDGDYYTVYGFYSILKINSGLVTEWTVDIRSLISIDPNNSLRVGVVTISQDESKICVPFSELTSNGLVASSGCLVFDTSGGVVFTIRESFMHDPQNIFEPYGVSPICCKFDSSGKLYLLFGSSTYVGLDQGNVFFYSTSGVFVDSYTADAVGLMRDVLGTPLDLYGDLNALKSETGILQSSRLFTIVDDYIISYDLSTGAEIARRNVSAPQMCQCDHLGNVYVTRSDSMLLCLDSDLELIWSFQENSTLSGSERPIRTQTGMRCCDGFVVIGGSVKRKSFIAAQLVIY